MPVEAMHEWVLGLSAPWKQALLRHGLDLSTARSPAETTAILESPLPIDWTDPRVAELSRAATRAVEPGDPARSLLYHMLALAECPETDTGVALADLDALENYIYARAPLPADWQALDVAVLAYQYRPARRTGHQRHADIVFSRLGIARNGDTEASYDAHSRSHVPTVAGHAEHVRVLPARYGAFLVRRVRGPDGLSLIEGRREGDDTREFLVPVRKLFASGCVPGPDLTIRFGHRHVGDKLRRAVEARWGVKPEPKAVVGDPPYSQSWFFPEAEPAAPAAAPAAPGAPAVPASTAPPIALVETGASVLLMPGALPLIEPLTPDNFKVRGFRVSAQWRVLPVINRRYTTQRIFSDLFKLFLEGINALRERYVPHFMPAFLRYPEPRNAPEYINIRHRWHEAAAAYRDMCTEPEDRDAFLADVKQGGYHAQLFLDHCAEGAVSVRIAQWPDKRVLAAYSVVAAPDFYPYADQAELQRWFREHRIDPKSQFRSGSPLSLSAERLPANPAHVDPFTATRAFAPGDTTLPASFSLAPRGEAVDTDGGHVPRMVSFLSDASSSVFAPGWDVTYAGGIGGIYLATHGLGSPFVEDIKLCAASNSFWPALSPDASRTFNRASAPTALPMLDDELGYHPSHPLAGANTTRPGWDGEYGPFLTEAGEVDHADIHRSDYVANALRGQMLYGAFEHVDSAELIRRIAALRHAVAACDGGEVPSHTRLWLVSARQIDAAHGNADVVYRFLFVVPDAAAVPRQHAPGRLRVAYREAVRCDVTPAGVIGEIERRAAGPDALALY